MSKVRFPKTLSSCSAESIYNHHFLYMKDQNNVISLASMQLLLIINCPQIQYVTSLILEMFPLPSVSCKLFMQVLYWKGEFSLERLILNNVINIVCIKILSLPQYILYYAHYYNLKKDTAQWYKIIYPEFLTQENTYE